MLAGHSLGSIVALTLVGLAPGYGDCLVVEVPIASPGPSTLSDFADNVEEFVQGCSRGSRAGTASLRY